MFNQWPNMYEMSYNVLNMTSITHFDKQFICIRFFPDVCTIVKCECEIVHLRKYSISYIGESVSLHTTFNSSQHNANRYKIGDRDNFRSVMLPVVSLGLSQIVCGYENKKTSWIFGLHSMSCVEYLICSRMNMNAAIYTYLIITCIKYV